MNTSEKTISELAEEVGIEPVDIPCDGGCGTKLNSDTERYSKYVDPMVMLLCPDCAEEAGWLDGE